MTVRIPKSLHERLSAIAESEYRSVNRHVILCLERCINGGRADRTPGGASIINDGKPGAGYDAHGD